MFFIASQKLLVFIYGFPQQLNDKLWDLISVDYFVFDYCDLWSLLFRGRTVEAGEESKCGLHAGEAGFSIRRGPSAALSEGPGAAG